MNENIPIGIDAYLANEVTVSLLQTKESAENLSAVSGGHVSA